MAGQDLSQLFKTPTDARAERQARNQQAAQQFGQSSSNQIIGQLGFQAGADLGGAVGDAFGFTPEEEKKAMIRLKVLQSIDIENPDSLLQGAKLFLEAGDPEAAFGLANRAGGLKDKALDTKAKESSIGLQKSQGKNLEADADQKTAETNLLGKKELGQRTQFEQILGNSDFPEEVKNKFRADYLNALMDAAKGKSASGGKPRTGASATGPEKDAVAIELDNRGLKKSSFDNQAAYDDYKSKVANLAKAVIKADEPLTTDYAEAVATVVDMLNEEKGLVNQASFPSIDDENTLDPAAVERVRARLGIGGIEGAPKAADIPKGPAPAEKPRRRITLTQ